MSWSGWCVCTLSRGRRRVRRWRSYMRTMRPRSSSSRSPSNASSSSMPTYVATHPLSRKLHNNLRWATQYIVYCTETVLRIYWFCWIHLIQSINTGINQLTLWQAYFCNQADCHGQFNLVKKLIFVNPLTPWSAFDGLIYFSQVGFWRILSSNVTFSWLSITD